MALMRTEKRYGLRRWSPVSKGNGEEARLVEEGSGRIRRCCNCWRWLWLRR